MECKLVKLVCPNATFPAWDALTYGAFKGSPVESALGTYGEYDMINTIFECVNPVLVYGNVQDKAFVAVKMTMVRYYKQTTTPSTTRPTSKLNT